MPTRSDALEIAKTLAVIEREVAKLRRLLAVDPSAPMRNRRALTLREAALRALPEDRALSLEEWETAIIALGYQPASDAKRSDQLRRSLSALAARNKHLIESPRRGSFQARLHEEDSWQTR